jgi:hypothetical protein
MTFRKPSFISATILHPIEPARRCAKAHPTPGPNSKRPVGWASRLRLSATPWRGSPSSESFIRHLAAGGVYQIGDEYARSWMVAGTMSGNGRLLRTAS